jgi:adenylyltransferase/sulfurtransferase
VDRRYDFLEARASSSATLCGRDAVQVRPDGGTRLDLRALADRLAPAGEVRANAYLVRFRAPEAELVVFEDGRAIVKGVSEPARARTLYAKYVGS